MPFMKRPPSNNGQRTTAAAAAAAAEGAAASGGGGGDVCVQQLEDVVDLLQRKASGDGITSAQVEAAVSGVLTNMGYQTPTAGTASTSSRRKKKRKKNQLNEMPGSSINTQPQIQLDMNNYDDDDDDENDDKNENANNDADNNTTDDTKPKTPDGDGKAATLEESKMNDDDDDDDEFQNEDESYVDQLSQIPLGKEGAKMMTTFGDGPKPNLQALKAALLGTRRSLQLAIMDARAIRRRAKQNFDDAKQTITKRRPRAVQADSVDPNMLFRALAAGTKTDRLSRNPKCGFDTEQLKWLFPEEMRSYQRWNEMHSEYTKTDKTEKQAADKATTTTIDNNNNDSEGGEPNNKDESVDTNSENEDDNTIIGGHLRERAANFDLRTYKMKSDWYLQKFSKVRQGSFLPKGFVAHRERSGDEVDWDKGRKKKKRGRQSGDVTWENMSSITVRFLHWLGFDPPALYPPNSETTQALAFLGYDMLGKIVEKAIFLRNLERMMENNQCEIDESKVLWELKKGEQLTKEDIDKAMDHPDVRPSSLHTTTTTTTTTTAAAAAAHEKGGESPSHQPSFQLYFGPGFEERLELEMEELVASEKKIGLSQDEIRTREQEALLFSKISSPPTATDGLAQLLEQRKAEDGAGTEEGKDIDGDNDNDNDDGGGEDEERKEDEGGKEAGTQEDEQK